jgi:hypothetical protein
VAYVDKKAGDFNLVRINPNAPSMSKGVNVIPLSVEG